MSAGALVNIVSAERGGNCHLGESVKSHPCMPLIMREETGARNSAAGAIIIRALFDQVAYAEAWQFFDFWLNCA